MSDWSTAIVLVCGHVLQEAGCKAAREEFITEAEFAAGVPVELAEDWCPSWKHTLRRRVICGHPERPPLAPDMSHREWTGHDFSPLALERGVYGPRAA